MENYIVLKSFYRINEQKSYNVGDIVSLYKDDAERLLRNNIVEKEKTAKSKK